MKNCVNDLSEMQGQIFNRVFYSSEDETIVFENDNVRYVFYHEQDCCESVYVNDIVGDLKDLQNLPLLIAREDTNSDVEPLEDQESYTWTFYTFATIIGYVTVRWLGTSNGYYSESVDCRKETLNH